MSHVATDTPSQVQYPWKAAVRTGVQAFLAFAALLAVAIPIALPFLEQYLPEGWVGYVIAANVFVAALAGVVARLMALPQLNAFMTTVGLGATPKA